MITSVNVMNPHQHRIQTIAYCHSITHSFTITGDNADNVAMMLDLIILDPTHINVDTLS